MSYDYLANAETRVSARYLAGADVAQWSYTCNRTAKDVLLVCLEVYAVRVIQAKMGCALAGQHTVSDVRSSDDSKAAPCCVW